MVNKRGTRLSVVSLSNALEAIQFCAYHMTKRCVIFAHDPGTSNYGFSIIRGLGGKSLRFQILQYGLIKTTINDLKGRAYSTQREAYHSTVSALGRSLGATAVIAERFQPRGVSQFTTVECINLMVGVLTTEFSDITQKLLTASQWKNALRRIDVDLDAIYQDQKRDVKAYRLTNHEIDACFMAVFALNQLAGYKGFEGTPEVATEVLAQMRKAERMNAI